MVFLILLFLVSFFTDDHARESTGQVKRTIDKVFDILKNKDLKELNRTEERGVKIREGVLSALSYGEPHEELMKRLRNIQAEALVEEK